MRLVTIVMLTILIGMLSLTLSVDAQTDQPLDDYFVEAAVSNPNPYVGEQIIYIFTYYAFFLPQSFPYEFPNFEGFWLNRQIDAQDLQVQTIQNRQYYVGQAIAEITPLTTGELVINPTQFSIDETVFRTGVEITSSEVRIMVRPLPENAPEGFSGAVGQFDTSTSLTPTEANLGSPLTFTLAVEGNGTLELLPAPDLSQIADWRVYGSPARYTASPLGGGFGQKVFTWTILPDQTGTQVFPGVDFVYFDPRAGAYQSIPAEPVTVDIFPSGDANTRPRVDSDVQNIAPIALRVVSLSSESGRVSGVIWLLWFLPPIGLVGAGIWSYTRTQRIQQARERRHTHALRRALRRLDQIPLDDNGQGIERILYTYIADKSLVSVQTLQRDGFDRQSVAVNDAAWDAFMHCVREAEGVRYIPVDAGRTANIQELIEQTREALKRIEREWGNG